MCALLRVLPSLAAVCAFLALREFYVGWAHRRGKYQLRTVGQLGGCGWASAAMCALYMWTGMAGLDGVCLPDTPGAVFKSDNVIEKQRVWARWGYHNAPMRVP